MDPVVPSTGWGVTHLFFCVHPSRSPDPVQAGKELVTALDAFAAAGPVADPAGRDSSNRSATAACTLARGGMLAPGQSCQ